MLPRDQERLFKIKEYCEEIRATIQRYGASFEIFQTDHDYQRSISFSILQIGELVGGLTDEYRNRTKSHIMWHQIKGMRNIVVHDYGSVKLKIIWDVATINIPELSQFCEEQLSNIE